VKAKGEVDPDLSPENFTSKTAFTQLMSLLSLYGCGREN
jgi:hypothetical protein